jgi:hypothetical protein
MRGNQSVGETSVVRSRFFVSRPFGPVVNPFFDGGNEFGLQLALWRHLQIFRRKLHGPEQDAGRRITAKSQALFLTSESQRSSDEYFQLSRFYDRIVIAVTY